MDKISDLKSVVIDTLDLNKAQDIVTIDLKDKSSMADYMIIASGTSSRHIQSLSEQVLEKLKDNGIKNSKIEGKESNEWKLVDGIDLIVHIFHPEKRKFYELEKINKQYVDEIDQSEGMDSAINGLLQSLDPYSSYMSPEIFQEMQTETSGEFGGLGIEVSMEAGVVKVITPIDDTPASKAGIKAGDYIVKIDNVQVQGKSLSEAVDLMRGLVGTEIELTIRRRGVKKALTFNITRAVSYTHLTLPTILRCRSRWSPYH